MTKGFVSFVREQGVVGLAVGLAIGAAAGETVKTIVDGFINPIVGFIVGGGTLAQKSWVIVDATADRPALVIGWGMIVSSFIKLIAVAMVIYYIVRGMGLDKLDKKKEEAKPKPKK